MSAVNDFPALSHFIPAANAISIAGTDSADIALANVLTGLSFAEPLAEHTAIIDGTEHPVIALPALDIAVGDEQARHAVLCEHLLTALKDMTIPTDSLGLMVTGDIQLDVVSMFTGYLALSIEAVITEKTVMATLQHFEQLQPEKNIENWLWVSLHAGCAADRIRKMDSKIATDASSEQPIPADAAIAVLLTKSKHATEPGRILSAVEPNADDPLTQPSQTLKNMFADQRNAQNSVLIHSMPPTAEGSIELYRLEQALTEKRETKSDLPWHQINPLRHNMASILGDLGVCQLPFQLVFQQVWKQDQPLMTLAVEGNTRITWKLPSAEGRTGTPQNTQ